MTTPDDITKSLNQLASVLAGRDLAIATNDLADDPFARIDAMAERSNTELLAAAQSGDSRALNQCQRKTQSLTSLATLAHVIRTGTDWDRIA